MLELLPRSHMMECGLIRSRRKIRGAFGLGLTSGNCSLVSLPQSRANQLGGQRRRLKLHLSGDGSAATHHDAKIKDSRILFATCPSEVKVKSAEESCKERKPTFCLSVCIMYIHLLLWTHSQFTCDANECATKPEAPLAFETHHRRWQLNSFSSVT